MSIKFADRSLRTHLSQKTKEEFWEEAANGEEKFTHNYTAGRNMSDEKLNLALMQKLLVLFIFKLYHSHFPRIIIIASTWRRESANNESLLVVVL